ncbi:MAG: hypothetical protein JJ971_00295 [Balneolaceae bacterium]|nr:hypothetical protein [Balneolaceae bacterium]MBO6544810.1 hypothetical protein [Balneolaceae bacterium]MBO6646206.1 hypothetical protein [Balneolaceae bacterium]
MEQFENIEKPLVYRLTDQWVPKLLFVEFLLLILSGLYLFGFSESISTQIKALFLSAGSYFGIKWIHYGHARKNPSMRANIFRAFIAFFWGAGLFLGFIVPIIGLLNSDSDLKLTILIFSLSGLATALGASHSWKYSFQIKAEEEN